MSIVLCVFFTKQLLCTLYQTDIKKNYRLSGYAEDNYQYRNYFDMVERVAVSVLSSYEQAVSFGRRVLQCGHSTNASTVIQRM